MARTIADALDGELDVILVRKLRAPGQPELAIGAVDEAGAVLKGQYFDVGSDQYMREEIRTQQEILRKRRNLYTRTQAAIRAVRARVPARIVVAIGVAPAAALERFRARSR